jgi:hypothetical protein
MYGGYWVTMARFGVMRTRYAGRAFLQRTYIQYLIRAPSSRIISDFSAAVSQRSYYTVLLSLTKMHDMGG